MHHLSEDSIIVQRLLEKKRLLELGDLRHKEIRPALVLAGGCMQGVFGGGCVIGFQELGLCNVFDVIVASSCGAGNAAYFLSGQTLIGTSIYYQDLIDKRFINYFRISKMIDIDYMEYVLRNKKKLDTEKIRISPTEFYVTLMDTSDGSGQLYDVKKSEDIITTLKAAMAIPGAYNKPVTVDGYQYFDCSFSLPIPVRKTISLFNPTDILVVLNKPSVFHSIEVPMCERIVGNILMRKFSAELRSKCFQSRTVYNESVSFLDGKNNIAVISPDSEKVLTLTQDPYLLMQTAREGARKVLRAFGIKKEIKLL